MNDVLAFRNCMAERGYEYTPDHAGEVLTAMEEFRQSIHDGAREHPEEYEKMANLSDEEKARICETHGIRPDEIDGLIELVLDVYEQERLF